MITSFETRMMQELVKQIDELITQKMLELADGSAASFDDYRKRVGFIEGLRAAGQIAEEVHKTFDPRN